MPWHGDERRPYHDFFIPLTIVVHSLTLAATTSQNPGQSPESQALSIRSRSYNKPASQAHSQLRLESIQVPPASLSVRLKSSALASRCV
jgi:hypothetical protein